MYSNEAEREKRQGIFTYNMHRLGSLNGKMVDFSLKADNKGLSGRRALGDEDKKFQDIVTGKIYDNMQEAYNVGCMDGL